MTDMKKRVLLGVTGCIAAYKACEVLRTLQKDGCEVRVVATENALEFVGRTTFDALSGYETLCGTFGDPAHPIPHIELAEWGDLFLIVPCTANVAAKIAHGIADDLLTSTALAAWERLAIAPAMNVHMYECPATQANLATLRKRGAHVIDPDSGYLACGDIGKGKLPDPVEIARAAERIIDGMGERPVVLAPDALETATAAGSTRSLAGKRVLVTAGPTHERIDDVRYIANSSSGKMGYALARAAADAGADVTLVSGPVALDAPEGVRMVGVVSAKEMLAAAEEAFADCDIAICSAAVADYAPAEPATGKLKKGRDDDRLESVRMVPNPDILATLCSQKGSDRYVVGFAAETEDVIGYAEAKLASKGADMIVANDVSGGSVFGSDSDKAWLVTDAGAVELPEMPKTQLASRIIDAICANMF